MNPTIIKIFLRVSIATAFLSAVADRFSLWPSEVSVWGNWENFTAYTAMINPWFPNAVIPAIGIIATVAEVVLALLLLVGYKTKLVAQISGVLLLIFALSMTFSSGIKGAFDYSVFTAAAAAFGLSALENKA